MAKDNRENNPITIKPKIVSHMAEQFSWVPLPYCCLPRRSFPIKCLALSAHVSPWTVHFGVLDKRPVSALERVPLPATEAVIKTIPKKKKCNKAKWLSEEALQITEKRNNNNLRYAIDTTLMAESEEELKSLLMKVKEDSEKAGLKLNIQKMKLTASGPINLWQIDGEITETVTDFIFLGSIITVDGDCSHEIKRHLLLRRKGMTNLDSTLKSRESTLPTKVYTVKDLFFPIIMYRCESWTIKKPELRRIDVFELWCWRRLLRVPWTARKSNQSILKEINPEYLFERPMLKPKLQRL